MPIPSTILTSAANPVVRRFAALARGEGRDREALVEGAHLVQEAIEAGLEVAEMAATPEWLASPAAQPVLDGLESRILVHRVDARLLARMADADAPEGVVARVALARGGVDVVPIAGSLYVYGERLQDPGNVGALARVAEAAGVAGLFLSVGSAHPNHPRALRASAGSLLRVPVGVGVGLETAIERTGAKTVALVARGGVEFRDQRDLRDARDSRDARDQRKAETWMLVLGSEGQGLSEGALALSQVRVMLPMKAPVESLNVAVAAGVVLYQLAFASRTAASSAGSTS